MPPTQTGSRNQTVVVVGGGVIGCSTAYYLSQLGWHVRVVEAGQVGRGASYGNCGLICPSHVLPLTMPGSLWPVARRMFDRDSPFYVRPRWDPKLWAWLVQFARSCRIGDTMRVASARHALLASSMALYRRLVTEESTETEWDDRGLLFVFKSGREFNEHARVAEMLREQFRIEAVPLDESRLVEFEPALRPGAAGGWHYPGDAHLRPNRLMAEWTRVLRCRGVEVVEETAASRLVIDNGLARAVVTSHGDFDADAFVLAMGARLPAFAKQLGCQIPIQPGKGYSITMPRARHGPEHPIIFDECHVAVTPWASGLRIGSTMEFAGYDTSINRRRIELFARVAQEKFVAPLAGAIKEEWCGWRPMTVDDLPCIGLAPQVPNVVVVAGHGMIGMATATASGKLAAELISGEPPHIDPEPYSLCRFG